MWLNIRVAAQKCGQSAASLRALADDGKISIWRDGRDLFIPCSTVLRLTRENAALKSARSFKNKMLNQRPAGRSVLQAAREQQDVLPMSSGRGGRDWRGSKTES